MAPVAASPVTLLPARRSIRSPFTGVDPRPIRLLRSSFGWLSNLITLGALVLFLGLAVGPHLFGYRTETMLSGSMAPYIVPGDIVAATKTPVRHVAVGDVISYQIPVDDHHVVSHRVVGIVLNPDGTADVRTKGDANQVEDPWTARIVGGEVWQVHFVVPVIGKAIRWLRQPKIERSLRFGAPAVVILIALGGIWRRPPAEPELGDRPTARVADHGR